MTAYFGEGSATSDYWKRQIKEAVTSRDERIEKLEAALQRIDLICHDGAHLPNATARIEAITEITRAVLEGR